MAVAMTMASCTSDVIESVGTNGDGSTVSFEIALNEAAGTRAISDGLSVDELVWEVYDKNGDKVAGISGKEEAFKGTTSHTLFLTLAKGQTYTVAFWAQKSGAYITDDLKRIELNYNGVAGNDESRDAFYAYTEPITVENGNFTHNVTLKRPFAQLNLGVSDLEAFEKAGIKLNQVEVEVSEVAANFNITTGEASGAVPAKFELADVLCNGTADTLLTLKNPIEIAEGVAKTSFPWLSMNYLLVNGAKGNVDVTFTIKTSHDDVVLTSENTPVQSNYRTNLIAKLTNVGEFKLNIDPLYDAESNGTLEDDKIDVTQYGVKTESGNYYKTLEAAITGGETEIQLADGEYTLSGGVDLSKGLVITGTSKEDVKINVKVDNAMGEANAAFENVTVVTSGENYTGLKHAGEVTFNDCIIENTYWCYSGEQKTTFNNCTFKQTDGALYNVWTYGSNVDFNNCVFYCAGKSVLVYTEGGDVWETVNFKNCKFYASAPANNGKAAIEIDSSLNPCNVNIENCTAEGFDLGSVSGNSLYNLKKGEEGVNCNITVAVADGVDIVKGVYEISNANGMFWFANEVNVNGQSFAGKTVKLMADIDLANQLWSPVGQTGSTIFQGTFDGNGKTISNLNIDETSDNATYRAAGLFGWFEGNGPVVKNLTIDGAKVKGHHYVAAIVAFCQVGQIEACTVKNAKISCVFNTVKNDDGDKAGAVVGYLRGTVDNCHAYDCAIDAGRDAGQLVGAGVVANVTNCTATNVTVEANGTGDGSNINETFVGRAL